jgi:amidohydrolase
VTDPDPHPEPTSHRLDPRRLDAWLDRHGDELVDVRREIHARPELGYAEHETTALLVRRLVAAGLAPTVLPAGTGLYCDVGSGPRVVALRADIDALPLTDAKDVPYRSTVPGVCHACGHDVHTAVVLGAGQALAALAADGGLPGRVRLVFQPAEEMVPGGALEAIDAGVLKDVERIVAMHCEPRLETGRVGFRVGPITAACDKVEVRLTGPGGHTARPHTTVDLVYALGKLITDLPALLSRRVDPRHGMSLVWGLVQAGQAANAIPRDGRLHGTVRMLSRDAWDGAEDLIRELVDEIVRPTGAGVEVNYAQGVPPVVNDAATVGLLRGATVAALGPDAPTDVEQSLGGEDFSWYLDRVPGALVRLGVRAPRSTGPYLDLHQPTFDVDEAALAVGVRVLVHAALDALT